jgi:myo-inositol 2-dehydrogenase/D-chiro-inositol 1-dehydrogenase
MMTVYRLPSQPNSCGITHEFEELTRVADQKRVRVGLIGLGRFGKLHGRILSSLAGVELVAAADPDSDAQSWAASELRLGTLYGTAGELLDHPGLDAVFIVSPEQMHAEHALAAIDRELPIFM